MQVHDTPVRLDSEDFAVTVNVGSGGAGVYYGVSSDPVVLASSGTLVAAGGSFVLTTPVWVVSATHGQSADLQLISSSLGSVDYRSATHTPSIALVATGADDGANLQAAINLLPNGGRIDFVPSATAFAWTTTIPTVPPGLSNELRIRGNGAKVVLSTTARRFLDPGRTADGQTFQNITLEDLVIDANNVMSNDHVIFGTYKSTASGGANPYNRCNFDRITLRDIRCINVPFQTIGTPLPGPFSANVAGGRIIATLTSYVQDASQEGASTYSVTNILFERVTSDGCNGGLYCNATQMGGATGTNLPVTMDNIVFRDCEISMGAGALSSTSSSGSCYQVGSYATGDRVRVYNCRAINCTDTAFEIDGMMDVLFKDCISDDHRNDAFFIHNFNSPADTSRQRTVFENCVIRVRNRVPNVTTSPSVGIGMGTATFVTGSVEVRGLLVETTTADDLTSAGQAFHIDSASARRIVLDGVTVHQLNTAANNSGTTTAPIWINVNANCVVRAKDIYVRATGTATLAAGSANYNAMSLANSAGTVTFTIDGIQTDLQHIGTANITSHGLDLGRTVGSSMRGTIRRYTTLAQGQAGGGSGGIRLAGNLGMNKLITITESDFTAGAGVAGWSDVRFDDATTTSVQRISTLMPRNTWSTANSSGVTGSPWNFAISNPTVPASATPYRNLSGFTETYLIAGGTITDISISRSGSFPGGARTLATAAPAAGSPLVINLEHGDYLQLTYTVAPTTYTRFARPIGW